MKTLIATSVLVLAATSAAFAASSQLDGDTLTIKLATTGTDHTTKTGIVVHDTIHGTLPNGDKFTARIYTPGPKHTKLSTKHQIELEQLERGITPCTTDADCEAKNPHIR